MRIMLSRMVTPTSTMAVGVSWVPTGQLSGHIEDEYNSAYYTHPIGDVIDIPWYIGTDSCGINFTPRKISAFALRTSATATATVHILWIRMVMSSASTVGMS